VMPEPILSYLGIELGIWGDGEQALPTLARKIADGEDFSHIPGLIQQTGGVYHRNSPQLSAILDLPLPRRELVDNPRYFREGGMGSIETKRGCSQQCIYCADLLAKGHAYRLRPPTVVADEIESLLTQGVDCLHLCDSEFNLPYEHAAAVCQEIMRRGLGERVSWYAYLAPAPFTEELALLMVRAGCRGINFGVDHTDDRILKILGRPFTITAIQETAAICHRLGIPFMYDVLLGGPGETPESLAAVISAMKEINPSRVGISAGVRIYPGTPLAEMALADMRTGKASVQGAVHSDFFAPVFYLAGAVGDDLSSRIALLVGRDERFFFGGGEEVETNYNYNDNQVLIEAIKHGYRGAFWDILRRLTEEGRGEESPATSR
jgi:radical SAM superfamily enzyme YgiQ (UPF0313 family)